MPADLAARLAESPRFVLAAGMLLTDGCAVAYRVHHDGYGLVLVPNIPGAICGPSRKADVMTAFAQSIGLRPVLTDAGTSGCLAALLLADRGLWVIEAQADGTVIVCDTPDHGDMQRDFRGPLGEACAAALLAIWGAP